MEKKYFFGIGNERIGPLDEKSIEKYIAKGKIRSDTLAWCQGMKTWKQGKEISELFEKFGHSWSELEPPPLLSDKENIPPPLPQEHDRGQESSQNTGDLGAHNNIAYKFIMWFFRSRRGRSSFVCEYVQKDPKKAMPVLLATVVGLILFFIISDAIIAKTTQKMFLGQQQQQPGVASQPGFSPSQYRAWRDQQQHEQRVFDEVYQYKRDAGDRMDETYKKATYDWYNDKD